MTVKNYSQHKIWFIMLFLLLTGLAVIPGHAEEDDDSSGTEKVNNEKKEGKEKIAQKEEDIKKLFTYSFNDVANNIVIITCESEAGTSCGSGFIAKMDGKSYLFTNQHVILGADTISFKTVTGDTLKPKGVELSTTRDIARFPLDGEFGFEVTDKTYMGLPVCVFGNSEGGGVATELYGEVEGVGAEKVEVSAGFVCGNSGSPILNPDQEVVGIASYLRFNRKKQDTEGTKFENTTRRFGYLVSGSQWEKVNWKTYNKKYGKLYATNDQLVDSILDIINEWYSSPFSRVSAGNHSDIDLQRWSSEHNAMVNRIVRLRDKGRATKHELDSNNKQIRNDIVDSAEALSKVCRSRARQMRFLAEQRELTEFLRDQFKGYAVSLESAAHAIDRYGDKLSDINFFSFKNEWEQ